VPHACAGVPGEPLPRVDRQAYLLAMMQLLDRLGYGVLLPAALLLGLAPFRPEPHLVEKLRMLAQGSLARPLDIFDLALHGLPALLLLVKIVADLARRGARTGRSKG
jgi:hypothetical protein